MNCPRLFRFAAATRLSGPLPAAAAIPRIRARRGVHTVPEAQLEHNHNEVPGLLSQAAFKLAWTDYQKLLVARLNSMISGTVLEQDPPKTILTKTARDPNKAHFFNHASMVFNNHFFFSGLSARPTTMSPELKAEIEATFGSVENLRREMSITALSMFGPGFVWLVRVLDRRLDKNASETGLHMDLRVLPTYLAGSPFAEAHWRRQSTDMNTAGEEQWRQGPLPGQPMAAYQTPTVPGTPGADGAAPHSRVAPGGANVTPLLCINTWEHVWLTDYGFGDGTTQGKLEYVKRWWHYINWLRVQNLAMGMGRSSNIPNI